MNISFLIVLSLSLCSIYGNTEHPESLSSSSSPSVFLDTPAHFPVYVQDPHGLWYFTFPTEVKRVKSLFSTKDNLEMISIFLKNADYKGNVLDCGAHIGTFSIPVASKITGTVFAFEIQKPIALQLSMNAFLNGLDVQVFNEAIGNPEMVHDFVDLPIIDYKKEAIDSHLGAFSVLPEFMGRHNLLFNKIKEKQYKKVLLKKIDSYTFNDLILVKVDVEGMDLDVVKGMFETLKRNSFPPIIFECHDVNSQYGKDFWGYLESIGYLYFTQSKFKLDFIVQHESRPRISL